MSIEQRNAQKLYNLINVANANINNGDIYFFLKCNVKVLLNRIKLSEKDLEILTGHMEAFTTELKASKWDLRHFDAKKYEKFLNDFFDKVDFRKVDTEFMFKCKDILEISPIKNVLYKKRMEFFDKKLPKIGAVIDPQNQNNNNNNTTVNNKINNNANAYNNLVNNLLNTNNNTLINNINNNINNFQNKTNQPANPFQNMAQPVNPFENMTQSSNPYAAMNNAESSPYQQNINITNTNEINNATNDKIILNSKANNQFNYDIKKIIIPEDIKTKILKELKQISDDIVNNKVDNCRQHSVAALLYFKQIIPD